MDGNIYVAKVGAIAAFLDTLGVTGNLHGPSVNLLAILNGLEEKFTSTNMPSTKSCATCLHEGDVYGDCFYCCRKCLSDWEQRKTSCVG